MGSTPGRPLFMRPAPLVVLEALMMGIPVKMAGEEWHIKDGIFGVRRTRMHLGHPERDEEVLLGVDHTLPAFIKMCEALSAQELMEISTNIGLNRHRQDQRKARRF